MRKLVPILVLLLVFSSGCTVPILNIQIPGLPDIPGFGDTVVQHENDIIIIDSFEAYPDEIDAGGTTKLVAYIENVGDATVENVQVDLFDYCQGLFTPRVLTCGPEELPILPGDDPTSPGHQGYTKCQIERILPKQKVPVMWSVCQNRADPLKVRTVCPPDGMKMSVRYEYTTSAITTISFMSLSEMQRQMIERTYDTTNSYIGLGQGPIKPMLTVEDKQPIPVFTVLPENPGYTNSNVNDARTVLMLQLKNMGSGQLDSKVSVPIENSDGKTREVVAISGANITVSGIGKKGTDPTKGSYFNLKPITPTSEESVTCLFAEDGSGVLNDANGGTWDKEVVRLVGKESSPYYCKIDVSELVGDVTTELTRKVDVQVKYDYLLTKNVFVTVNPKIAA